MVCSQSVYWGQCNFTVRAAAALLAENETSQKASNGTLHKIYSMFTRVPLHLMLGHLLAADNEIASCNQLR